MSLKITNVPRGERNYTHPGIWTAIIVVLIVCMAIVAFIEMSSTILFWLEHFGSEG